MNEPVRVGDVLDYLRAHGWAMTGRWRSATVWSLREFDVLVPPSDAMADTAGRLRELVRCVADAEGRTPRAVSREIASPAVDVVSYRAHGFAESVTLPMGFRSLRAARDLVAICAREEAAADSVGALLDRTLLSLSEEVFGVDISLPYEDLGRRTALHVLHSSKAALDGVFEDVSAEVCVALSDLAGVDRLASFELGFRWSRRAPLADESVTFPRGAGERIRAATKRTVQVDGVGVVEGPVQRLADDENGERWCIGVRGVLQIDGTPAGKRRLVPVWLRNAQDYAAALEAHKAGRAVRAQGPVQGRGIAAADNGFTVTDRL